MEKPWENRKTPWNMVESGRKPYINKDERCVNNWSIDSQDLFVESVIWINYWTICFWTTELLKLVGVLEHAFILSIQYGNVIIPTDELHHFSEG